MINGLKVNYEYIDQSASKPKIFTKHPISFFQQSLFKLFSTPRSQRVMRYRDNYSQSRNDGGSRRDYNYSTFDKKSTSHSSYSRSESRDRYKRYESTRQQWGIGSLHARREQLDCFSKSFC